MDNKPIKEGKNISKIVIAVLAILLIGTGTLFVLEISGNRVSDKKVTIVENNSDGKKDNNSDATEQNDTKILSGVYDFITTTIALYKGNVYARFDNCPSLYQSSNLGDGYCDAITTLSDSYKEYEIDGYANLLDNKFNGLKLDISNAKDISAVMFGQDYLPWHQGLAIIKSDGSLSFITFQSIMLNKLTPKSVSGLKNIVKVENVTDAGSVSTIATDSSGKTYDLNNYISAEENLLQ